MTFRPSPDDEIKSVHTFFAFLDDGNVDPVLDHSAIFKLQALFALEFRCLCG